MDFVEGFFFSTIYTCVQYLRVFSFSNITRVFFLFLELSYISLRFFFSYVSGFTRYLPRLLENFFFFLTRSFHSEIFFSYLTRSYSFGFFLRGVALLF